MARLRNNSILVTAIDFLYQWPFSGIGYATQVIEAHLNVYYVVILAWAIFYLFNCFTTELPWAGCGHYWNTGGRRENSGIILRIILVSREKKRKKIATPKTASSTQKIMSCSSCFHRELRRLLRRKCHQHHKPQRNLSSDRVLGVSTFFSPSPHF